MNEAELLSWYEISARPFLQRHASDRIASIESDYDRLRKLLNQPDHVTVCFLGNSGVGKSTLLNALAAGDKQILPAGGIGPLTAQATEVHYSAVPSFRVVYHPRKHLWQLAFGLEGRLNQHAKAAKKLEGTLTLSKSIDAPSDFEKELSAEDREVVLQEAEIPASSDPEAPVNDPMDGNIKQAKQIVCGNQFAENISLEYLVDALRTACDYKTKWNQTISPADMVRIDKIRKIIKEAKADRSYERRQSDDPVAFLEDMKVHAAGFLSPLIERIEVGWPSDVLKSGVILVDLPGVGIAQDSYRDITKSYVRDKARAVIVVIDRAGPTQATVDMLRTSGFWSRLVGAADDPTSDPCSMLVAVTRVDDITQTEWQGITPQDGTPRPKKREVFARLVEEFKPRMRSQISEQLGKLGESTSDTVKTANEQALKGILNSLEIHPVSAPELRKMLIDDDEDRSFLNDAEQTGVPQLQQSLMHLAQSEREIRRKHIEEVATRLGSTLISELQMIGAAWRQEDRAVEEAARLESELAPVLKKKSEEYGRRASAFREFLNETVQAKIEALVLEAREVAEQDVRAYLYKLQGVHWATLRAAVTRGGCYYGSTAINLPDDISGYFQGPMAAVWGQKLLRDIRKRTTELAADIEQMVNELCEWAKEHGGASVDRKMLEAQQERIKALSAQMQAVGKEAVADLRDSVKSELTTVIRKPISAACKKFVDEGDHIGSGVKSRILELFRGLATQATNAAKAPAMKILQTNFEAVRIEIQTEFKKGGNPIQDTANLVVERHEAKVKRSDAQRRGPILVELDAVFSKCPVAARAVNSSPAA
jgi:GTP-binding protein EngB required for normal cell division